MLTRPDPREVVIRVREVLGDELVGAQLHGSATFGGLQPYSDIDVLGVIGRRTAQQERRALVRSILEISGSRAPRGPARPVELTLVVQSDVRPWRYPPRCEFQYGEWLRDTYEAGLVPGPTESPDLTTLLAMVLRHGQPLLGPPAGELLDTIPVGDTRRAMFDSLPELLVDLDTDRNVVLTLARMWMMLEIGAFAPKAVAAEWALARLPDVLRPPLAYAREWYLGRPPETAFDGPATRALAAHVVEKIERAQRAETGVT